MRPGLIAAIAAGLLAIARPMLAESEEDSERTTLPWRTGLSPGTIGVPSKPPDSSNA